MEVIIKAYLQEADAALEVRRIPVTTQNNGKGIFKEVFSRVGNAFPGLVDKKYSLKWKDADGDLVMVSTDEELQEALALTQNAPLKIFITVEGVKEKESEEPSGSEAGTSQEQDAGEAKASDHQKEDPFEGWPFMGPTGMPFPPPFPPDCGFGDHAGFPRGFCGMRGMPKGGHQNGNPHCLFGGLGPRGHFNPRGHFTPHDHHFGHMGPRGHHFGARGGHHFGGHMGMMFGPFGCQDVFEGEFGHHGDHHHHRHGDHHHHHHGDRYHHHGRHHHGEGSWKAKLRDAVPVAHRRWAKAFIRNWRVENLKNATSTSSESEQDICFLDAAGVPEAYVHWLNMLLPKWHRRQGEKPGSDSSTDREKDKEKGKLKASVPLEFRKWAKWYLVRHFAKKEAPVFCKNGHHDFKGRTCQFSKKSWKKSCKMETLTVSIPLEHRAWAKAFIRAWRQEHSVPDPKTEGSGVTSSESEDVEEAGKGDVTVPADYTKWLQKYLARWHLWKGQVDGQKLEKDNGGDEDCEDGVPKNFRKWVKCFLWHRYGKGAREGEADTACQYQKWLHAFQKKWLQEQAKKDGKDELGMTSSDDEASTFTEQGEQSGKKRGAKTVNESDTSEAEAYPGFHHWAKHALKNWDGVTPPCTGFTDGSQIPHHVDRWMSKMMMKMQIKRMKKEFKEAKHSMKAAMKARNANF